MGVMTYADAAKRALAECMREEPTVWAVGEDLGRGGVFGQYKGLQEEFGAKRIVDAPISGGQAGASLTLVFRLVLEAQRQREPVAWIHGRSGTLFPPDAAEAGGGRPDPRGLRSFDKERAT